MKKLAAAALAFAVLCAALNALGGGEQDGSKPHKVEVTGRVRLVGSSPMTSLVITGESREWFIYSKEQDKLMHLQQQMVTVRAKEYYFDRVFANGMSAGRHYYLKDIVIISPKR